MTKAKTKKIPPTAYGQPGGNQPGRATQFGQPGGNPPCQGSVAANQREFYRWVESRASEEELKADAADKTKPAMRRNFVKAVLNTINAGDPGLYFDLTNQTHGLPKQTVEQTSLPEVVVVLE
jgi:hypothetical protein